MKQRILTAVAALLCALALFTTGAAPVYAYAATGEDSGISTQAEQVRWYYRMNHGVKEMRLWSITYMEWITDWVPCPIQP